MLVSALPSRISSMAPTQSRLLLRHIARGGVIANDVVPSSSPSPPRRFTMSSHPFRSITTTTTTKTTLPMTILRRAISTTSPNLAQITVNVPSMGDSITEGTIVEWCVPPGSHVNEGDVLCLVETDKVTVDIKADRDGILIRHLGEVEGVVEVGQGLYVMEADAGAKIATSAQAAMDAVSAVDASLDAGTTASAATSSSSSHSHARKKSIQFLGKEGWRARMTMIEDVVAAPAVATTAAPTTTTTTTTTVFPTSSGRPNAPTSITHIPYSPMFGRPAITDEEMMALMLGGADEAPIVMGGGGSNGSFSGGKIVTAGPRGVWLAE